MTLSWWTPAEATGTPTTSRGTTLEVFIMAKVAVHRRTDGQSRGTRIKVKEDRFKEDKQKHSGKGKKG